VITVAREAWQSRELLWILMVRSLRIRYQSSALGFLWTLLGPVLLIAVYTVFLALIRFPMDLPSLITGILAWHFLSMCLGDGPGAIVGNASLVTKARFPRVVLPASMVAANLVNFALSFVVLAVYLLAIRHPCGPVALLLPAVVLHIGLCLGAALLVSSVNVFFRDTEHIVGVTTLVWFFLSPVIYGAEHVLGGAFPAWMKTLFFVNPMSGILTAYRAAFLGMPLAPTGLMALSAAVAIAVFAVGVTVFTSLQERFGDEL
jgi:ABC-type polysaccharide/polyol phosphate export permease